MSMAQELPRFVLTDWLRTYPFRPVVGFDVISTFLLPNLLPISPLRKNRATVTLISPAADHARLA